MLFPFPSCIDEQRCGGVPPTILISVLSQLPLLKDLRLKGAPATAIPTILTFLPNLQSLDTECLLSGSGSYFPRYPRRLTQVPSNTDSDSDDDNEDELPHPVLRHLTVRTSSIDNLGPHKLWAWIRDLIPLPGLETFRLHAFTINGHTAIPRMFVLDLAAVHGDTLKHFLLLDGAQLTLNDIECLCSKFPKLETLVCSTTSPDVVSLFRR